MILTYEQAKNWGTAPTPEPQPKSVPAVKPKGTTIEKAVKAFLAEFGEHAAFADPVRSEN